MFYYEIEDYEKGKDKVSPNKDNQQAESTGENVPKQKRV